MNPFTTSFHLILLASLAACSATHSAPEPPTAKRSSTSSTSAATAMPEPSPKLEQHAWLDQFVGEWTSDGEGVVEPGQAPLSCKGSESVRSIGLWIVGDIRADSPMGSMQGVLTLGYNPEKKRFVGTWVTSMMNHMWYYEGSLDASRKVLTLEAEGPSCSGDGTMSKYKDVYEFKSRDHKVTTSWMTGPDGKWVKFMTGNSRRKN